MEFQEFKAAVKTFVGDRKVSFMSSSSSKHGKHVAFLYDGVEIINHPLDDELYGYQDNVCVPNIEDLKLRPLDAPAEDLLTEEQQKLETVRGIVKAARYGLKTLEQHLVDAPTPTSRHYIEGMIHERKLFIEAIEAVLNK